MSKQTSWLTVTTLVMGVLLFLGTGAHLSFGTGRFGKPEDLQEETELTESKEAG